MDRQEIRARIAARPASESLQEAAAAAAYEAALEAQRAGVPSSVRAGLLVAFTEEWKAMEAARAELLGELDAGND